MGRRTICLDFDGVLHSYTSGWEGATNIPDPPVPGMVGVCKRLAQRFGLIVLSARAAHPGGIKAIETWLAAHGFPQMVVTAEKPVASLYVDDRGYRFNGDARALEQFALGDGDLEPWNRPRPDPFDSIRTWKGDGHELFEAIRLRWRWPDYFRTLKDESSGGTIYELHTGGWSDHEQILAALQENTLMWALYWRSSSQGGHHTFRVS